MSNIVITPEEALQFACPSCGAQVDEKCRAHTGSGRTTAAHKERIWEATEARRVELEAKARALYEEKRLSRFELALQLCKAQDDAGIIRAIRVEQCERPYDLERENLDRLGLRVVEAYNVLGILIGDILFPYELEQLVASGMHVVAHQRHKDAPPAPLPDYIGLYTHGPWWARIGR